MAWDIFKGKDDGHRAYGRGAPPPVGSHEWAGVAPSAAEAIVREERKKATTPKVVTRASVGAEERGSGKRSVLLVVAGFVVGLIAGSWGRGDE